MFYLVPVDASALGGKEWLWIERPSGEVYLLMDRASEIRMTPGVAASLAVSFLRSPERAAG